MGWAFSPTLKCCWGRNPNLQKAISYTSRKATRHVRGALVPAFTLAEVLITLGIIGVVAAMTLPALLTNTTESTTTARLKKFYSIMNQAIKMAELDYGACGYWDYDKVQIIVDGSEEELNDSIAESTNSAKTFIVKYIAPYVKGEITDDFSWKTSSTVLSSVPGIKFADGSFMAAKAGSCIDILFDVNGSNQPNTMGIDQFVFLFCNAGNAYVKNRCFSPYYNINEYTRPRSYHLEQCKSNPYYCSGLIILDNWEFKDDYPYNL